MLAPAGCRGRWVGAAVAAYSLPGAVGAVARRRWLGGHRCARPGTFGALFGVGRVIGDPAAPFLRRWPVWPTMTAIVFGWGLALIPLGLPTPLWAGLATFFAAAVIWAPWTSLSMAVFQDASPPAALAQVIAARSSLLLLAAPLSTRPG